MFQELRFFQFLTKSSKKEAICFRFVYHPNVITHLLSIELTLVNVIKVYMYIPPTYIWSKYDLIKSILSLPSGNSTVYSITLQWLNLSVHIIYVIYLSLQTKRKYLDSFDRNKQAKLWQCCHTSHNIIQFLRKIRFFFITHYK